MERLDANQDEVVYLDCVLGECVSVIARRMKEQGRGEQIPHMVDELGSRIPDSDITWASSEWHRLYRDILGIVKQTSGALNFNDALIGLLCKEWGVGTIASFDRGFDILNWVTRMSN